MRYASGSFLDEYQILKSVRAFFIKRNSLKPPLVLLIATLPAKHLASSPSVPSSRQSRLHTSRQLSLDQALSAWLIGPDLSYLEASEF